MDTFVECVFLHESIYYKINHSLVPRRLLVPELAHSDVVVDVRLLGEHVPSLLELLLVQAEAV